MKRPPTAALAALPALREVVEGCPHGRLYAESLSLDLGVSKPHFTRLFRAAAGTSPHRYLLLRRADRARVLLRGSGLSLVEVAVESGFASQSHMSVVLQRVFACTPGDLRHRTGASRAQHGS